MASLLHEMASAVRARRIDMGLTQAALAQFSGLSRATINQVEKNTLTDLSIRRASRLLDVLGLSLVASAARARPPVAARSSAIDIAARTASVSYRVALPPGVLRRSVMDGRTPAGFEPHLSTLLDEAPVSLLARVVEALHVGRGVERALMWQHLRSMARELQSRRDIWQ